MRALVAGLVLVLGLLASAAPASAQRSLDIGRFRPALDHHGFFGVQGTNPPGPWRWNVGMWLSYAKSPLVGVVGGEERDVIRHRFVGDFQAQLGIGGRFALGLDVPLVLHQSTRTQVLEDGGPTIPAQAVGDPRVVARVRLVGQDAVAHRERSEGPGLALMAAATLPLGDEDAFAGEGQLTLDLQAIGDFRVFGLGAGLMLGWRHRPNDRVVGGVTFRDQLLFGFGLQVPVPVLEGLSALLDVRGEFDARFGGGSARRAVEGTLGVALRRNQVSYTTGVGVGFTPAVGTPSVRVVFGVQWAPRTPDQDADGIPDDEDECPHLPEDFDGFEDEDGCMDPDNDMDFIPDVDDRCPNEEALEGQDADEDGCTDPAPAGGAGGEGTPEGGAAEEGSPVGVETNGAAENGDGGEDGGAEDGGAEDGAAEDGAETDGAETDGAAEGGGGPAVEGDAAPEAVEGDAAPEVQDGDAEDARVGAQPGAPDGA